MIFSSVVSYNSEGNKEPYLEGKKKSFATQLYLYEFYFFYLYDEIELVVKFQISEKIHDSSNRSLEMFILFSKNLILSTQDFNCIIEIVSFICIVSLHKLSFTMYNIS